MYSVIPFSDELTGKVLVTACGRIALVKKIGEFGDVDFESFLIDPGIPVGDDIDDILSRPHAVLTVEEATKMFAGPLAAMKKAGLLTSRTEPATV